MVRFIHTSDWQLGMTRHYLDADAQPRFTADRIHTVRRILTLAQERACDFVVVAGDVFEHPNLHRQDIGRALEAMGSRAIPVYLLPGNHDPLGTGSLWSSPSLRDRLPHNVVVLDRVGTWPVRDGVELVAAPWSSKSPDTDPVAACLTGLVPDGTLRIVVGHGMLEDLEPDVTSAVAVRRAPLEAAVAEGTIHYVALGDRHIRWPVDGHGVIHYSGTHESTSFREPGRGHVLEVQVDAGQQPVVTAHQVGSWQHVVIHRELNSAADISTLARDLSAMEMKENTIVKTACTGSLTVSEHATLDEVMDEHRDLFAALYPWERHTEIAIVPDDDQLAHTQWTGYIHDTFQELMEQAAAPQRTAYAAVSDAQSGDADDDALPPEPAPPDTHLTAQDAVRLLVRLAGGTQ